MNDKFNQLYNYLKSNGMTDLDAQSFYDTYRTDSSKLNKLYGYLKSNGMTDLDPNSFRDSYFGSNQSKQKWRQVTEKESAGRLNYRKDDFRTWDIVEETQKGMTKEERKKTGFDYTPEQIAAGKKAVAMEEAPVIEYSDLKLRRGKDGVFYKVEGNNWYEVAFPKDMSKNIVNESVVSLEGSDLYKINDPKKVESLNIEFGEKVKLPNAGFDTDQKLIKTGIDTKIPSVLDKAVKPEDDLYDVFGGWDENTRGLRFRKNDRTNTWEQYKPGVDSEWSVVTETMAKELNKRHGGNYGSVPKQAENLTNEQILNKTYGQEGGSGVLKRELLPDGEATFGLPKSVENASWFKTLYPQTMMGEVLNAEETRRRGVKSFEENVQRYVTNKNIANLEEEEAVKMLTNQFGRYGFEFIESGAGDEMIVRTKDGSREILIDLDTKDLSQNLRLQDFLIVNQDPSAYESGNQKYAELINRDRRLIYSNNGGNKVQLYRDLNELFNDEDYKIWSQNLPFGELDQEINQRIGEYRSLMNEPGVNSSQVFKDMETFKKSPMYQQYQKQKKEAFELERMKMQSLYDEVKLDPGPNSRARQKVRMFLSEKYLDKTRTEYNAMLNDINQSAKFLKTRYDEYNAELQKLNTSNLTPEQIRVKKEQLDKMALQLDVDRSNLVRRQRAVTTEAKQLEYLTGRYVVDVAKEGGFIGGLMNSFSDGISKMIKTGDVIGRLQSETKGSEIADNMTEEEKRYYKTKGYSLEEIKIAEANKAWKESKEDLSNKMKSAIGDLATTKQYQKSEDRNIVSSALFGLAESLPAMATSVISPYVGFGALSAQAYSSLEDEMLNDPDFETTSLTEMNLIALPYAMGMGALEKIGLSNVMSKNPLAKSLIMKSIQGAVKKTVGKGSAELLQNVLDKEIKSNMAKFGLRIVGGALTEAETGATQSLVLDIGYKSLINEIKKDDRLASELTGGEFFDTPDTFMDGLKMVIEDGIAEGIGGMVMSGAGAVSQKVINGNISLYDNEDVDFLKTVSTDNELRKMIVTKLKGDMLSGKITKSEAQNQLNALDKVGAIFNAMPDNLSVEDQVKSVNLMSEKQRLEKEIDGKDQSLVAAQKERITEIDNELQKISKDAFQKQTTGEVPVQPEARVGEEVEGREPETKLEEATKEGQEVTIDKPIIATNTTAELDRVKSVDMETEDGATFNIDGTKYEGGGLVVPIVSENTTVEEITPEMISDFVEKHSSKIGDQNTVKVGIYKFPNSNKVSIDLNIVAPESSRQQAIEFAKAVDQESLFDLSTFENVKTGGTGANPTQFTDDQFKEIAKALNEGRTPSFVAPTQQNLVTLENVEEVADKRTATATKLVLNALPDVKIYIHNTNEEYSAAIGEEAEAGDRGAYDTQEGAIHINLAAGGNAQTVFHEAIHHALLKKGMDSGAILDLANGLNRIITDKKLKKRLSDFISQYETSDQAEEYLSELGAIMAEAEIELTTTKFNQFKALIARIFQKLGLPKSMVPFLNAMNSENAVDFINSLTKSLRTGEEIIYESNTQEIKNPIDKIKKSKIIGSSKTKIEIVYVEQDRMQELIDKGLLEQVKDISVFNGKYVATTSPDDMLVGNIFINGDLKAQGNGGLFFVTKFGDVWASSNKIVADQIANRINKSLEINGGKGYLVLVKGTDAKLISSPQGASSSLKIVESLVSDGLISPSDFRKAVISALQNNKDTKAKINFSGKLSSSDMISAVDSLFDDVSKSSFDNRGTLLKSIIVELGKTESTKINSNKIIEFLGGDTSKNIGWSETSKNTKTSQSVIDLIAGVSREELTKGLNGGDIYAIIEVNDEVKVSKDSHQSYPFHIKQKNGKAPKLILLENRQNGRDVMLSSSNENIDELGKSFDGKVLGRASNGYGDGYINTNYSSKKLKKQKVLTSDIGINRSEIPLDESSENISIGKMTSSNGNILELSAKEINLSYPGKKKFVRRIEAVDKDGKKAIISFWRDKSDVLEKDNMIILYVEGVNGYGTDLINTLISESKEDGVKKIIADDVLSLNAAKYWEDKLGFSKDPDNKSIRFLDLDSSKKFKKHKGEKITAPVAGNKLFNEPLKDAENIARSYMQSIGMEYIPVEKITKLDEGLSKRISDAYDQMENNPNDPKVKAAYEAMAKETLDQYDAIVKEGYNVEINNNEPYSNSEAMIKDLKDNKRMKIFSTESGFGDEPITEEQRSENLLLKDSGRKDVNGETLLINDVFRFVHDFFGHAKLGNSFGPVGEENAWRVHSEMYSPEARKAMTSETRGQNSWVNFSGVNDAAFKKRDKARELRKEGKIEEADRLVGEVYEEMKFADQKVGILPDFAIEEGTRFKKQKDNTGYRSGDLIKKAETKDKFEGSDRSTGHFGTGFYFFGTKNQADQHGERATSTIDLDGYNLAKGTIELHDLLKDINNNSIGKNKNIDKLKSRIENLLNYLGKSEVTKLSRDYSELEFKSYVQSEINQKNKIESIINEINNNNVDSPSTVVMKSLGFDGVDSRGTDLDNAQYGSVVYSIKKFKKQKPTSKQDAIQKAKDKYELSVEKRGNSHEQGVTAALGDLQKSDWYVNADDTAREDAVREIKAFFGEKIKKAPSVAKVLGKPKPEKQTKTVDALRKEFFTAWNKASREAKADLNSKRKAIGTIIKSMVRSGKITTKQSAVIADRASSINLDNPVIVQRFLDYVAKVFADANYQEKLSNAFSERRAIRRLTKSNNQAEVIGMAKAFLNIDPSMVEDIDTYNEIADSIKNAMAPSVVRGEQVKFKQPANIADVNEYTMDEISRQEEIKKDQLLAEYDYLKDAGLISKDMTLNEIRKIIEDMKSTDTDVNDDVKDFVERRLDMMLGIVESIIRTGVNPITGEAIEVSDKNKDILKAIMKMDLKELDTRSLIYLSESVDNFLNNGITSGLESNVQSYVGAMKVKALVNAGVKSVGIKTKASKIASTEILSIPLLFEKLFRGTTIGTRIMSDMGLLDMVNGKNKAELIYNKILESYTKQDFYGKDFMTQQNIIERGMLAYLMRNVNGDKAQVKAELNRRIDAISESIEQLKEGNSDEQKLAEMYENAFSKLKVNSRDIDIIRANSSKSNREAVDWWVDQWKQHYTDLYDVSLSVYNTMLSSDTNYTPDKMKLMSSKAQDDDLTSSDSGFVSSLGYTDTKKAGVLMENVRKKPKNRYVDLNFDMNNANSLRNALVDINTAAAIRQVKGFMDSNNFDKLAGDESSLIKSRVNSYVKRMKGKRMIPRSSADDIMKYFNAIAKAGTIRALGGVGSAIKQFSPVINTLLNAGRFTSLTPSSNAWIDRLGMPISNRGIKSEANIDTIDKRVNVLADSAVGKVYDGVGKIGDMWLKALIQSPDAYVAKSSFITYYLKSLKDQGLSTNIDWNTHEINKKAAEYAQMMVDRQQNVSDPLLTGELFATEDATKKMITKLFMPFTSFVWNQRARMINDMQILGSKVSSKEDKIIAMKSLAALPAEVIVFNLLGSAIRKTIDAITNYFYGEDDDEEEEVLFYVFGMKVTEDDVKEFKMPIKNLLVDLFSPLPGLTDEFLVTGFNNLFEMYPLVGDDEIAELVKAENDIRIANGDKPMTEKQEADFIEEEKKKRTFQLYENMEATGWERYIPGAPGVALKTYSELKDAIDLAMTGKYEDEYQGRKTIKYISDEDREKVAYGLFFQIPQALGLLPREAGQIPNKGIRNIKKRSYTENQKTKIDEVEKLTNRPVGKIEKVLIGKNSDPRKIAMEMKMIDKLGGFDEKQEAEYAKLRRTISKPSMKFAQMIKGGMTAEDIIRRIAENKGIVKGRKGVVIEGTVRKGTVREGKIREGQ